MTYQIDFLDPEMGALACLRSDLLSVKESSEKVRKGIFVRHNELVRKYAELHERMQIIERNICTSITTKLSQS